jgi:Methyltransferase domain
MNGILPPALFRSRSFHLLLKNVWRESTERPGAGELGAEVMAHLPAILDGLKASDGPEPHAHAFLLGLVAEAAPSGEVREALEQSVADFLALLSRCGSQAASPDPRLRQSLVYLLAQFPRQQHTIVPALSAAFGVDAWEVQAVTRAFAWAEPRPAWARATVAYLGAEAAHQVGPDQSVLAQETLVCPECHGGLAWGTLQDAVMRCVACGASFNYLGDVLDLVPSGPTEAVQFTPELVASYEEATRPRFVKVMGGGWAGALTPEYEEAYLARHLRPKEGAVLDLACGAGGWTRKVAGLVGAHRVVAMDFSPDMLQACLNVVPTVLAVRGDASRLPVADGVLGGVNCSDALQALPDPAQALREVARCLQPGAPLTAFTFLEAPQPYAYFQRRFPLHPRHVFSPRELQTMVADAGLEMVDWGRMAHAVFFTAHKPA